MVDGRCGKIVESDVREKKARSPICSRSIHPMDSGRPSESLSLALALSSPPRHVSELGLRDWQKTLEIFGTAAIAQFQKAPVSSVAWRGRSGKGQMEVWTTFSEPQGKGHPFSTSGMDPKMMKGIGIS